MRVWLPVGALLFIALSGCVSPPAESPLPTGQIDGAVLDQLLNPYGNTTVTLTDRDGEQRADVTSRLGGFTFRAVTPGFYTLTAHPEGSLPIEEPVAVQPDDITRIILQTARPYEQAPYIAKLQNHGRSALATPDMMCEGCSWSTTLQDYPEEMVLRAQWEDTFDGSVRVLLRDGEGTVLADVTDQQAIWAAIDGDHVGDLALSIEVHFIDVVPRYGFNVDTFLDVYYGAPRSAYES